jgi:hypothetical protein
MKIKKVLTNLFAGAAMLAIAGTASATTYELNIYGASAQFTFWNTVAPAWIQSQSDCGSGVTPTQKTFDSNNKVTYATCSNNTYIVRVSSKASYDGILALKGDDSQATAGSTAEKCSPGDPSYPGSSLEPYYRKMADETSGSGSTATALKCVRVSVGASDVAGASFTQSSYGNQHGTSGSAYIERSFSGISIPSNVSSKKPFVVPFAFYVNTDNTVLNSAMNNNITRMMAVLLFSGQIDNWSELGTSYPNLHTVVCLRHAGSGTHATLDYAVLEGHGWGAAPAAYQNTSFNNPSTEEALSDYDNTLPDLYFNDTTGDEQTCVHNNAGAIGYYDADKADFSTKIDKTNSNVKQIAYQGEYASADAILHGRYDFWTNEWAYYVPSVLGTDLTNLLTSSTGLLTYVSGHIPSAETNFWVDQSTMTFEKATDQAYPQR